jgi:hypothetical protein
LKVYSDDPRDLSTLDYDEFRKVHSQIIAAACSMLGDDRFACFVVGDVRDRKGFWPLAQREAPWPPFSALVPLCAPTPWRWLEPWSITPARLLVNRLELPHR